MGKRERRPRRSLPPREACALCLNRAKLCNSHIIPEFCYRPSYDVKHRACEVSSWNPRWRATQIGKREHLLCEQCDNGRIGAYDTYFKRFWFDGPALPSVIAGDTVVVRGADYARFKLFHLSVLWRASVSSDPGFRNVRLGPYGEKLRVMLLDGDPGPQEAYPIWGTVILMDDRSAAYEVVSSPLRSKLGAFTVYYMCYGGCEWSFVVNDRVDKRFQPVSLKRNAPLRLAARPLKDINSVRVRFTSPPSKKSRVLPGSPATPPGR